MDQPDLSHAIWRKSSYSNANGECVEVAAWHKSSYSSQNGECIEVARDLPGVVAVRDSKDPHGPVLVLPHNQWADLTSTLKA